MSRVYTRNCWRLFKPITATSITSSHCSANICRWMSRNVSSKASSKNHQKPSLWTVDPLNTNQPQNEQELWQFLRNNIFLSKDGLLAITKPPGVSVSGEANHLTIASILPLLAESLNLPRLEIIKAPEKECSGLLLMATDNNKLEEIRRTWNKPGTTGNVERRFLAITMGIPEPCSGKIQQPVSYTADGNNHLTVPVKNYSLKNIKKGLVKTAVTEYRVLSVNTGLRCALVELTVTKLRHHQIQVHLGHKMCSILGDHLYSTRLQSILGVNVAVNPHKVQPQTQELSSAIRRCLGISNSWQRNHIPLHLHWYQATIPGVTPIMAPTLPYFNWTLKQLQLTLPNDDT